MLNFSGMI